MNQYLSVPYSEIDVMKPVQDVFDLSSFAIRFLLHKDITAVFIVL